MGVLTWKQASADYEKKSAGSNTAGTTPPTSGMLSWKQAADEFDRYDEDGYKALGMQRMAQMQERYQAQKDRVSGLERLHADDTVNDWLNRYNRVIQGITRSEQKRNGGFTRDADSVYGAEIDALLSGYDGIKNHSEIRQYYDSLTDLKNSLSAINESFSQFEDESAFDQYMAYWKDQEEKKNLDINAYAQETQDIEKALNEYKSLYRWEQDKVGNDRLEAIRQKYGGLNEMESLISDRQKYLTLAKRIQEQDAERDRHSQVLEKPDFSEYSGFDASRKDIGYQYVNADPEGRLELEQKYGQYAQNFGDSAYDSLTEEEKQIYNYYMNTGDKESAAAYLKYLQKTLNYRKGQHIYESGYQDQLLMEYIFGAEAGLDQFRSGIQGLGNLIAGRDEYVAPSAKQYASQMMREDLADDGWKLPSWLGGASLGQIGYDAITTTANMVPSIVTSTALSFLNPAVGAAAGGAMLGGSAAGNAYQEAINEGYSVDQARGYGILSGASEIVMEKLLGGISAYGGNALGKFFTQNMKNADTALRQIAKNLGGSMLSEFSEEYLQEVLTPVFRNLTLGTDEEVKLVSADALYAGFLGAITGGIIEGPQAIVAGKNATEVPGNATVKESLTTELASSEENATADTSEAVTEESPAVDDKMKATEVGAENATTTAESTVGKDPGKDKSSVVRVGVSKTETVQQAADIESFAQQFGTQADAVRRNYMEGQDLQEYELGFEVAYTMGRDGGKAEALSKYVPYLSQSQREIAFSLGRDAAAAQNAVTATTEMPAASEATQTVQISTGTPVEIARISNVDGNGGMTFELADGRTINADDIQHTHSGEAVLYEAVADLGASAEASNKLVDAWKNDPAGVSAESYAAGMIDAFNYGRYNIPETEMAQNESIQHLTAGQRNTAYQLGKAYGHEITQVKETRIQNAGAVSKAQNRSGTAAQQTAASRPGGNSAAVSTGTGKVHFDRQGRTLSAVQETGLKTMEQLSQLFGTEFHVFESYEKDGKRVFQDENGVEQSAPNGWYDPKTGHIHIDLNAGSGGRGTMLFTVAHELTHFIRDWSPAKFDKLAEAVFELVYKEKNISVVELVRKQQAKAARNGMELSFDEAYEEVVADSMESILTSGNVVELMAELKQQDKSLWQKIRKWFQDLAEDIRKLIDAYAGYKPDSAEGRAVATMEEMLSVIESFYMDALQEASANYQAAEGQKNTTQEGGKKNSFAGRNAATADYSALQQAKQLQEQGVDNETIRQRVGWFKGMDGKWRFEIDDSQMEISKEISNYMRLGDLMQNEKLYAAYPDMADIDVVFQSLDAGVNGSYHPQFDSINLSYKLKNDPIGLKDALVHELQHAIQQREGFTKGATAESWERKKKAGFDSRRAEDIRKAQETERELRRIQEEEPEFYRDMVELNAMTPDLPRGEIDWETLEKIEDDPVEWQQYDARREELEAKYGDTKVWDMNNLLYQREQAAKNVGRSGVELYFDTAGEIEARDASNRRSKTPEQRKSSPPRLGNEDTVFAESTSRSDQAIGKTVDNKPFVIVERDILDGVAPSDWVRTVTQNIRSKFPNGVTVGKNNIAINQKSRRELTYSEYMHRIKRDNPQLYSDKLRATDNLDEIIQATTAWISEGLKHERSDNIQDFARGTVLIQIGSSDYSAEVVVGTKTNGTMLLYDILNLQKTEIADKKTDASVTSESRNDSTDRQLASYEETTPFMTGTQNLGESGSAASVTNINGKSHGVKAKQVATGKKFSQRDPLQEKAVKALEKENAQLKVDVSQLRDLVKLQKKLTGGKMVKPSSVESAARVLKKATDATGDTKELAKLLGEFYAYIANGEELTWEGVQEAAQDAADWLWNNRKQATDEYSTEILKDLRTRGVSFNEDQKSEAAVTHDTFANYRKALFGSVKITENGMPLDEAWHELSGLYPGVFPEDTNSGDMPRALVDIVARLRSSDRTYMGYDEIMARQSLIRDVYDSYWNVSTLYTVADVKQKEINALKSRHAQRISDLRTKHREKVEQLHLEQKAAVEAVRAAEQQRSQERTRKALDKHRENQKQVAANRAELREKTEVRRKIRKTVMELDKLLNRGDKKKNVKDGMSEMVSKSLKLAEALFMDEYSNRDMLRNGVGVELTDAEEKLFREAQQILQQAESGAAIEGMEYTSEVDAMNQLKKLDQKLSSKMAGLKDVFARERKRLYGTTVSDLLGKLADEYSRLSEAEDGAVRAAKDENVYAHLLQLQKDVGGTTVRDMTLNQMEAVADAFTMVLTTVRNANKMFAKNLQFDRETVAGMLVKEFQARKIPSKKLGVIAKNLTDAVGWNYEKLHYALERINSPTLTRLFGNLADSENITMRDVQEAKEFQAEMVEKYHYNDWDIDKKMEQTFLDNTGKEFHLTLGELLALYAYSRRDGADKHIEVGGFTFGETALTDPSPATTYKLTPEQVAAISNLLTAEQKSFAEAMQKYLSKTMGAKGNEVTMKLYGIEMFTEENYFPLHIAGEYKAKAQESQAKAEAGFQTMTNAGFTKARNTNATAPIVLEDFMGVWADHVNEMSRYHGAVPALEDIRRVMNYSVYSDAMQNSVSVTAAMTNAYGKQAVQYFDNLYREANSGAVTDRMDATSKKLLSLFRKNSVAYSASVVIQQPASIYRAKALIDGKYFGKHGFFTLTGGVLRILNRKKWNASYAEMMKYAPGVTMAKEIGGFDTSTGSSIRSYLLDTDRGFRQSMKHGTLKQKAGAVMGVVDDNFIANLPNVADKLAWIEIWEACKRETVARNPKMHTDTEAFCQKVGQRFTEVIRATQVYDSMFSKSPMLKSRNLAVQYAVSFMNEPNTVINMAEQAVRDLGNKEFRKAGKTVGALATSIVATNLLKSIIYAMRDEDEDETFQEKYLSAVASNLMSDINVLNYIPIARDVWSIWEGYDVERSDMAIVADAIGAIQKLRKLNGEDVSKMTEEELEAWDKKVMDAQWRVAETLCPIAGIPLKNIRREVLAVINAVKIRDLDKSRESTELSIRHAIEEATGKADRSDRQKLYDALVSGDSEYADRLKNNFDSDSSYESALRKALREHDPRIKEMADAYYEGDYQRLEDLSYEIEAEGVFAFDTIKAAYEVEKRDQAKERGLTEEEATSDKAESSTVFSMDSYYQAIRNGNSAGAETAFDALLQEKLAEHYLEHEAESSIASSVTSKVKAEYLDEAVSDTDAISILTSYGGKSEAEAETEIKKWDFQIEHNYAWESRDRCYRSGTISREQLVQAIVDIENTSEDEAELQVEVYDWETEGYEGATVAAVRKYNEHCAEFEVPRDTYLQIRQFSNNTQNDVDEDGEPIYYSAMRKVIAEIDAQQGITSAQKDAIARSLGWSEKNIQKYKTW